MPSCANWKRLEGDETLLVQSGRPVGVFRTHEDGPARPDRQCQPGGPLVQLGAVPRARKAGPHHVWPDDRGSWIYIGTQGILQGTYETFAAAARKHFGGSLKGKLVVTGGLGGMGGAQPLAATMNGAAFLGIEVDAARIRKRIETGYCDTMTHSLDEALTILREAMAAGQPKSVGLVANCAERFARAGPARRGPRHAHRPDQRPRSLNGYIPAGLTVEQAAELRARDPQGYLDRSMDSIAAHVRAMLDLQRAGAVTFDYGNNIRRFAADRGVADAFRIPGFVPEYIRPLFCEGRGPFRWVALSGEPSDIAATDQLICRLFPSSPTLTRWISLAQQKVHFQGLPARICWLGYGERARFALEMNRMVASGKLQAPIVIGRDHLDCGSVASPYRETEGMLDASDAIADWPILNALLNTASGASWVSVHNGGGVGIGYSQHAGQVTVADGTDQSARCLERVMTCDPGIGVLRHVDAGYQEAIDFAGGAGLRAPMRSHE
jgi:urocanate hydratase